MVPFNIFCGSCFFCARGPVHQLPQRQPERDARSAASTATRTPRAATTAGRPSTCACRSPTSARAIIPDWMDDEDAVLLHRRAARPATSARSSATSSRATTVVVFGAGPVGLFAAKSAWLMGAGRVIVVDHLEYRLEKARDRSRTPRRSTSPSTTTSSCELKKHDRTTSAPTSSSTRSAPRPTATSSSTSPRPSSSCRAARRSRSTGRSTRCARAAPSR